MSTGVNINFKVTGSDLTGYMDKIKQKQNEMASEALDAAKRQTDSAKEQVKAIEEYIRQLERKNKLEVQLAQQQAAATRDANIQRKKDELTSQNTQLKEDLKAGRIDKGEFRKRVNENLEKVQDITPMENEQYKARIQEIKEQERQNTSVNKLLREQIDAVKTSAKEEVKAIQSGDAELVETLDESASPEALLRSGLVKEQLSNEKKKGEGSEKDKGGKEEGIFGAMLRANVVNDLARMVGGIPQAKNELDFVKPFLSSIGALTGGLIGNIMDAVTGIKVLGTGAGQTNFGGLGMELGKMAGEFFGNTLERSYQGREALTNKNFALQALTGKDFGVDAFGKNGKLGATGKSDVTGSFAQYGLDYIQTADLQYQVAQRRGNAKNLSGTAENVIAADKGLGVAQETSFGLMELLRSSKESNRDFLKLTTGVLKAGQGSLFKDSDRTFLNEFLSKNFSQMQRELLKYQTSVASGTTMDILNRFNAMGGELSAKDPRSTGLVSQINTALVNPGSDNLKALSFMALRKDNPQMGIADLIMERQKGLSSPTYLKSMMRVIDQMGGDDQMKIMNIAGAFGLEDKMFVAKRLFQNRNAIINGKAIDQKELEGGVSEEGVRKLGESQVGKYTKSTAEIQNAFIDDVAKAVKTVGVKMTDLFGDMIGQLKDYITGQIKGSDTKVRENITTTAEQQKRYRDLGLNPNGSLNMTSSLNKF